MIRGGDPFSSVRHYAEVGVNEATAGAGREARTGSPRGDRKPETGNRKGPEGHAE